MKRIDCEHCENGEYYEDDKLGCRLNQCKPTYEDMNEIKVSLLSSFKDSFINSYDEFIANPYSNDYFRLEDCEYPIDVECKVLEWLSRPAIKGQPYAQEWRNKKYRKLMQDEINTFFDTHFSEEQFVIIYQKLGNACRHELTKEFIESGYDFTLLSKIR